jgi:ssDNA-specific exonuclease RecJ
METDIKKQLNILIQLAEADKHFATVEKEMIYKIAEANGATRDLVNDLIRHPTAIENLDDLSENAQFDYLWTCARLIFVDKKIFDAELNFAKNIATKLGFQHEIIDFMVKVYDRISFENVKVKKK